MHKSENTLLIWVLTWAALLLALLYSPIGSPDLYKNRNYFIENQGVNFSRTEISKGSNDISFLKVLKNAPKNSTVKEDENTDLNIPVVNDLQRKKFNYTVPGSSKTQNKYVSGMKSIVNSYRSSHGINESDKSISNSGNSGGGGGGGISNTFASGKSSQNNAESHNAGVSTMGVDLSLFGDSTVNKPGSSIQKAGFFVDPQANDLTTDPLGSDTTIPIPEGWSFLILLAFIYSGYIIFKKKLINFKFIR